MESWNANGSRPSSTSTPRRSIPRVRTSCSRLTMLSPMSRVSALMNSIGPLSRGSRPGFSTTRGRRCFPVPMSISATSTAAIRSPSRRGGKSPWPMFHFAGRTFVSNGGKNFFINSGGNDDGAIFQYSPAAKPKPVALVGYHHVTKQPGGKYQGSYDQGPNEWMTWADRNGDGRMSSDEITHVKNVPALEGCSASPRASSMRTSTSTSKCSCATAKCHPPNTCFRPRKSCRAACRSMIGRW